MAVGVQMGSSSLCSNSQINKKGDQEGKCLKMNKSIKFVQYSLTLFDHFRPVKRPGEYFAKEWSE